MGKRKRGGGSEGEASAQGPPLGLNVWAKLQECRPWPGTHPVSCLARSGGSGSSFGARELAVYCCWWRGEAADIWFEPTPGGHPEPLLALTVTQDSC